MMWQITISPKYLDGVGWDIILGSVGVILGKPLWGDSWISLILPSPMSFCGFYNINARTPIFVLPLTLYALIVQRLSTWNELSAL